MLRLHGCCFWRIPNKDLDGDVREVWQETHDIIADGGLTIDVMEDGRLSTNFPKQGDHPIAHVRPHTTKGAKPDALPEGTTLTVHGNPEAWPDLTHYPKHCFWLNNTYIRQQLNLAGL